MKRRFAEQVVVSYLDAKDPSVQADHTKLINEIESRGLLYPVTVMDGVPIYDGAVSYPAIMRAVGNKIAESETAQA
jgi:disulfide oxidoreductase YuzD